MIFSQNFWLTAFCLFVNGLNITCRWAVGSILLLEFLPAKTQSIVGGVLQAGGAMPLVIGTIISMTTHNTKWILVTLLIVNFIGLICLLGFKIVPESPAYLYSTKNYEACREVLCKIAVTNNHEGNGEKLAQIIKKSKFEEELSPTEEVVDQSKSKLSELFSDSTSRRNTISLCMIMGSLIFAYYLISLSLKYLNPENIYMNSFMTSGSEIAGKLLAGPLCICAGKKPMLFTSFGITIVGVILLAANDPEQSTELKTSILMNLARFGASMAISGSSIVMIMIIKTSVVSTAMGVCIFFASSTSLFAPIVAEMQLPMPMVILSCFLCVSTVAVGLLKEETKEGDENYEK
jgi:hypothetical protein